MITTAQIKRLRDEAFAAGDALQGYVCRLALGTLYTEAELAEVSCLDHSERKELLAMSQEEAYVECESVLMAKSGSDALKMLGVQTGPYKAAQLDVPPEEKQTVVRLCDAAHETYNNAEYVGGSKPTEQEPKR